MTNGTLTQVRSSGDRIRFERKIAVSAEKSPFVWATAYVALPKGIVWSFDDMKWQIEIFDDLSPSIVVSKPTQVGLTTISTLKSLWFASYYTSRVMYTLPRRDDVTDYVATTVNPIIEGSEFLSTRIGKTDTLRMKRIGDSYFHVMEASVTPRMLPVDLLVNDEVDLSDQDNLEQFVARLDRSQYKFHYRFSTPTVTGYGIDSEYEKSDMREWVVTCSRCKHDLVLDWDVHLVRDADPPHYMCDRCKGRLRVKDIVDGKWVPMNSGSSISGYRVSHMMLPITRPPEDLLEDERNMDRRTFYNLRLGRPWRPVGGSMPIALFRDNSFGSGHNMGTYKEKGYKYYLGADQAKELHVVVGRVPDGESRMEIVYAEHIRGDRNENQFDRLGAIMRMFDIDFGICDANPNRASIYSLAREFHGKLGAADIGEFSYPFRWHGFTGDAAYKMTCSRSDTLDGLRDDFMSGKISFWGTWDGRDRIINDMISHCANLKRDTADRKLQSGGIKVVSIWRRVGEDHFAFALALLRLAALVAPNTSSFDFVTVGGRDNNSPKLKRVESKVWKGQVYYVEEDGEPVARRVHIA